MSPHQHYWQRQWDIMVLTALLGFLSDCSGGPNEPDRQADGILAAPHPENSRKKTTLQKNGSQAFEMVLHYPLGQKQHLNSIWTFPMIVFFVALPCLFFFFTKNKAKPLDLFVWQKKSLMTGKNWKVIWGFWVYPTAFSIKMLTGRMCFSEGAVRMNACEFCGRKKLQLQ